MGETDRLEVCFEEALATSVREQIATRLDAVLRTADCGRVIGSETFTDVQYSNIWSKVYISVTALAAAVRTLRRELRSLEVGLGTWVVQYEPQEGWYEVWFLDESNPPTWGW
jgi:hypothetical protein